MITTIVIVGLILLVLVVIFNLSSLSSSKKVATNTEHEPFVDVLPNEDEEEFEGNENRTLEPIRPNLVGIETERIKSNSPSYKSPAHDSDLVKATKAFLKQPTAALYSNLDDLNSPYVIEIFKDLCKKHNVFPYYIVTIINPNQEKPVLQENVKGIVSNIDDIREEYTSEDTQHFQLLVRQYVRTKAGKALSMYQFDKLIENELKTDVFYSEVAQSIKDESLWFYWHSNMGSSGKGAYLFSAGDRKAAIKTAKMSQ